MEWQRPVRQTRCALCGRDITREPIVKQLDDEQLEFDESECETIFDRLISVYGTAFGLQLRDS